MKKLLLFGGTTEGRQLAEELNGFPLEVTVSVATEYGREMLACLPQGFRILSGRMDAGGIYEQLRRHTYGMVVDATHPYAQMVTQNIRGAAKRAGVPYYRLLRRMSGEADCLYVPDIPGAVVALEQTSGNILLTTGSKELYRFTALGDYRQRLYIRVLPTVEAIQACEKIGMPHSRIIAMQGPFTREMNVAMMKQYDIRVLVTRDGGAAGGFAEKMMAAEQRGIQAVVIGRPEDEGMDMEAILGLIQRYMEESW